MAKVTAPKGNVNKMIDLIQYLLQQFKLFEIS